jgi:hypothetical protein
MRTKDRITTRGDREDQGMTGIIDRTRKEGSLGAMSDKDTMPKGKQGK